MDSTLLDLIAYLKIQAAAIFHPEIVGRIIFPNSQPTSIKINTKHAQIVIFANDIFLVLTHNLKNIWDLQLQQLVWPFIAMYKRLEVLRYRGQFGIDQESLQDILNLKQKVLKELQDTSNSEYVILNQFQQIFNNPPPLSCLLSPELFNPMGNAQRIFTLACAKDQIQRESQGQTISPIIIQAYSQLDIPKEEQNDCIIVFIRFARQFSV